MLSRSLTTIRFSTEKPVKLLFFFTQILMNPESREQACLTFLFFVATSPSSFILHPLSHSLSLHDTAGGSMQTAGACGNDEHCGRDSSMARRWSYHLIAVCWHPTRTCSDTEHRLLKKNKTMGKKREIKGKFRNSVLTTPRVPTCQPDDRGERRWGARARRAEGGRSPWIMTAASGLWEVVKQRAVNPIRMCHLWPHQSSLSRDHRADRWTCSAGDITRLHSHVKMFTLKGSHLLLEETVTDLSRWTEGLDGRRRGYVRILSILSETAPLDALECSNGRPLQMLW